MSFQLQKSKSVVSILATGATNGETVTANIDTLGYNAASIDVILGTSNTASNNPSTLKLSESDDTVVTNFADITAFVGDGTGGFTIPTMSTAAENVSRFDVDLRGRKRYLRLTLSPVTTQAAIMAARLYRGTDTPDSASELGVGVVVRG
jgi:hypothetical protein